MNTDEEYGDEGLSDCILQLSIQDSCLEAFLKSAASLEAPTDENLRVLAAIEQGEVLMLRGMLRHICAFRESDARGWLPVHRAAMQPDPEVLHTVLKLTAGLVQNVKNLLEHGASPHNTNTRNESPLLLAVKAASLEITQLLVAHDTWVEQVCRKQWTAMHEAAKVGNVDILMLLLRNGGQVNQKDVSGGTPLAVAAEHSHYHIIEILLNCGSSVNARACNGESILLDASGSGNTACIQLLLDNGADPNLPSTAGHLPLHKAAFNGHFDALKMLIPLTAKKAIKAAGQSPVHSASEGGQSRCLKHLLACGFDVNYRMNARNSENYSDMRRSALYFAVSNGDAESGRYDIVKLLLAAKADVNCYFTYCLKDEVMMRLLLNNGYKVERCFHCHHDDDVREANEGQGKIPFCEFMSLCCVMHLSGTVVRTLLDYADHVQICSKFRLLLKKQREWPDICDILNSPRSLRHLCRLEIRRRLTLKRLNKPEELDLYSQDLERII
ncbi:hypothetical protein KUCAC02_020553 [Chaenocephalus aceratus]|nr:hypothetical protein KUCAC02_020553 [Chaenocephalus aceratus]